MIVGTLEVQIGEVIGNGNSYRIRKRRNRIRFENLEDTMEIDIDQINENLEKTQSIDIGEENEQR